MIYLLKGGKFQRDFEQYRPTVKDKDNLDKAKQVAFNYLYEILVDKYVFKCDGLRLSNEDWIGYVSNATKNKFKFLQEYGIPNVAKIYEGVVEAHPNRTGRAEIIKAFDYLLGNDDARTVTYHKAFKNGYRIK